MKSIKEKAEEHLRESNITQYEYKSYIEGAGFGANYVLDAIEEFLNLYGVWCMSSSARAYLKDMIEQLKSNQ